MTDCRLILGDCLAVLKTMANASADAIVTDPPAGIGFMGKAWDKPGVLGVSGGVAMPATMANRNPICRKCRKHERGRPPRSVCICPEPDFDTIDGRYREREQFVDFLAPRLAECLRVARPGARMLCWALPRTSHWTGTAIEDAGWLIEDRVAHLFGQGFPKAKSKLKPAMEDWWVARKPGGKVPDLNIDQCRIGMSEADADFIRRTARPNSAGKSHVGSVMNRPESPTVNIHPAGRWPASLCLSHHPACRQVGTKRVKGSHQKGSKTIDHPSDWKYSGGRRETVRIDGRTDSDGLETVAAWQCHADCPVAELDAMSGDRPSGTKSPHHKRNKPKGWNGPFADDANGPAFRSFTGGDSGGASRFFATFGYFPKASRRDRGEGNSHPTVKSQDLMRWLIRLICKPGDTLIDPFAGSGSTLLAAPAEGVNAIGIEADPEYHAIAERRIAALEAA